MKRFLPIAALAAAAVGCGQKDEAAFRGALRRHFAERNAEAARQREGEYGAAAREGFTLCVFDPEGYVAQVPCPNSRCPLNQRAGLQQWVALLPPTGPADDGKVYCGVCGGGSLQTGRDTSIAKFLPPPANAKQMFEPGGEEDGQLTATVRYVRAVYSIPPLRISGYPSQWHLPPTLMLPSPTAAEIRHGAVAWFVVERKFRFDGRRVREVPREDAAAPPDQFPMLPAQVSWH